MQQKNLIVFIVLSILILTGWSLLQNVIWPPPPAKEKEEARNGKKKEPPRAVVWQLTGAAQRQMPGHLWAAVIPADMGLAAPLRLATQAVVTERYAGVNLSADRPLQVASLIASPWVPGFGPLFTWQRLRPDLLADFGVKPQDRVVDLSPPDSFLQVKLTTQGGGVLSVVLPKFQAATELGRPAFETTADGQRVPEPFTLVPPDSIRPAFLFYHYRNPAGDPDEKSPAARAVPLTTLGDVVWNVEDRGTRDGKREVAMWYDRIPGYPGLKIVRTYTLGPKDYHVGLEVAIEDTRKPGKGGAARPFRYQLTGAHHIPIEGEWYASVTRQPMLGLVTKRGHLWRDLDETQMRILNRKGGERVPLRGPGENFPYIQYAGVANQYFASLIVVSDQNKPGGDGVPPQDVVAYARATLESQERVGRLLNFDLARGRMEAMFTDAGLDKLQKQTFILLETARQGIRSRTLKKGDNVVINYYDAHDRGLVATGVRPGSVVRPHLADIAVNVTSQTPAELQPGQRVVHKYLLYNGPVKVSLLGQFTGPMAVDPELVERYWSTLHLRTLTDYHSPGWIGSFANAIFWTDLVILFTRLMHWLLDKLHFIVPNYGIAIILLTIIVRGLMFPISRRQALLSIRMQALAPEMKKLQEKYKNDPQERTRATMELYRKHGVNPLGGCLPLLLQLPIFMGLYYALQESIHFRLAGFLWIKNLAAPDMLIYWGESIPIISNPDNMGGLGYLGPFFNLLPVGALILMIVQQKMMTPPAADPQQEFQQSMMKFMMIFIGILFYKLAAGLCLYFIVSSLWGLAERKMLPKKTVAGQGGPSPPPSGGGGPRGGRPRPRGGPKAKEPEGAVQKVRNWWQEVLKQARKK